MTRPNLRPAAAALIAAPLLLALGACKQEAAPAGEPAAAAATPLAVVAPPAGKAWSDVVAVTPEGGYLMGNPQAPIKLVEYGSLTCSHCAEFAEAGGAELRDKYVTSGRVSFEFRNFVRDPIDLTAAQLTRCGAPESFFALTEQTFANQEAILTKAQAAGQDAYSAAMQQPENRRNLALADLAGLTEFYGARGISKDQATACLADTAKAQALAKATTDQAEQYQIQGTPTFLFNGTKFEGNTWALVKAELERLGAR